MVSLFKEVVFGVLSVFAFFFAVVSFLLMFLMAEVFFWVTFLALYSAHQTRWMSDETYASLMNELLDART